jgi:SAM-dependent methyltransferase
MRKAKSLDGAYFEDLYQRHDDPWNFASSPYEKAKYSRTLEVLGERRANFALEVGCSIGILTQRLARHCDHLTATDISKRALDQARDRCADLANVSFRLVSSAEGSFEGVFDLIVLSEVIYYWDDEDAAKAAEAIKRAMTSGGRLLLVHWLGETDYPKSADEAVDRLGRDLGGAYDVELAERTPDYRLDLWCWKDAR